MSSTTRRFALLALGGFSLVAIACQDTVSLGREGGDAGVTSPPSFTPDPPDGGDAEAAAPPAKILACMGTECEAPYATCSDKPFPKCGTNLMNDPANCGACGNRCGGFESVNMDARCIDGACVLGCMIKDGNFGEARRVFRDCNGLLDDGCETNVQVDPENCGICGHACAPGVRCINGKCGCSNGLTDCGGRCTDTRTDSFNCGACGTVCEFPEDACSPLPPNSTYGCAKSQCGQLQCSGGFGDCNNDLQTGCSSDGCEVDLRTDPNNCGGCGVKCAPDQVCRDEGGGPHCFDACEKAGRATCPQGCMDLLSDPFNCGACMNSCPPPRANQVGSCRKGLCAYECLPGFADCNGDPTDGCEIDLRSHPANCGACGNQCNFGEGQPCIEGKCLMVECDGGVEETK